jgi:hypothetical protein
MRLPLFHFILFYFKKKKNNQTLLIKISYINVLKIYIFFNMEISYITLLLIF